MRSAGKRLSGRSNAKARPVLMEKDSVASGNGAVEFAVLLRSNVIHGASKATVACWRRAGVTPFSTMVMGAFSVAFAVVLISNRSAFNVAWSGSCNEGRESVNSPCCKKGWVSCGQ